MDTQDNTPEEGITPSDTTSDQTASATESSAGAGTTSPASRPLGAWLRLVDRLISREFAAAFADDDVTRRDWMLLNAVSGAVDAPWMTAHAGKRIARLARRGWIAPVDDGWVLTDAGREARDRLGEKVDAVRAKVAGALADDEFAQLHTSLEAIARGLGWDESQPMPPRRGRSPKGRERGAGWGPFDHGHGFGGYGHEFGERRHHGHGFGDTERAFNGPRRGYGQFDREDIHVDHHGHMRDEFERRHHGDHAHHHKHGAHHKRDRRAAEHAYERGFAAGFSAGAHGAAPTPAN